MLDPLSALLTFWQFGIVSDAEAETWLNEELVRSACPSDALLDLVCHGPAKCMRWAEHVFPVRPAKLSYQDEFALRGLMLDLNSDEDVAEFARWAVFESIYEDRQNLYVSFACEIAALFLEECDVWGGVEHVKKHLPGFRPQLVDLAWALADSVPGLAPDRLRR